MKTLLVLVMILLGFNLQAQQFLLGPNYSHDLNFTNLSRKNASGLKVDDSNTIGLSFKFYPDRNTYYSNNINGLNIGISTGYYNLSYLKNSSFYKTKLRTLEIPVLFSSKNEDWGLYGEIGLNYTYNFIIDNNSIYKINKNLINPLVGFGFESVLTNNWRITTGLRSSYNMVNLFPDIERSTQILKNQLFLGLYYHWDYYHDNH